MAMVRRGALALVGTLAVAKGAALIVAPRKTAGLLRCEGVPIYGAVLRRLQRRPLLGRMAGALGVGLGVCLIRAAMADESPGRRRARRHVKESWKHWRRRWKSAYGRVLG